MKNRKGRKNVTNERCERIVQFDHFGESVGFNFSENSSDFKSCAGALFTCLVMLVTLAFTVQNVIVLKEYQGTRFMNSIEKNGNLGKTFSEEDGLQFAIGVIDIQNFYEN